MVVINVSMFLERGAHVIAASNKNTHVSQTYLSTHKETHNTNTHLSNLNLALKVNES
jgi:hypothetical protein